MHATPHTVEQETQYARDVFELLKPRITIMALLVALAGVMHARTAAQDILWPAVYSLLGIGFLVSGSGALNMFVERDLDKRMERTRDRPLPSGRLSANVALVLGIFCVVLASSLLWFKANPLSCCLGLLSLITYLFLYTPLKQKSWVALLVGSVPGAMPVVLGYVAISGRPDPAACALFFWAFLWQIPHFLAISLFREHEYHSAGFAVMSVRYGQKATKQAILLSSWLLVVSTGGLFYTGIVGRYGMAAAVVLGVWFLVQVHQGVRSQNTYLWARRAFRTTLFYQSLLFVVVIVAGL